MLDKHPAEPAGEFFLGYGNNSKDHLFLHFEIVFDDFCVICCDTITMQTAGSLHKGYIIIVMNSNMQKNESEM